MRTQRTQCSFKDYSRFTVPNTRLLSDVILSPVRSFTRIKTAINMWQHRICRSNTLSFSFCKLCFAFCVNNNRVFFSCARLPSLLFCYWNECALYSMLNSVVQCVNVIEVEYYLSSLCLLFMCTYLRFK